MRVVVPFILSAFAILPGGLAAMQECSPSLSPLTFGYVESDTAPQVQLAAGSYAFFTIDGCNACTGGFAVAEADELAMKIIGLTEAEFSKYQVGNPYTSIASLSASSTTCSATNSLSGVTGPSYVVVECPSNAGAEGCNIIWAIQYTKNTATSASCASPYQTLAYDFALIDSGEYYYFNNKHPSACGTSGSCTDVTFSIAAPEKFSMFSTDLSGYDTLETGGGDSGLTKYASPWSKADTYCHSGTGLTTPVAAGNRMFLVARCDAPAGSSCQFASLASYKSNPNGVADDDAAASAQCQQDAQAAFSTWTRKIIPAGTWNWDMRVHSCGASGSCTDVEYAVLSASDDSSPVDVFFVPSSVKEQVTDLDFSWETDGTVIKSDEVTTCAHQTIATTPSSAGHSMYVAIYCEGSGQQDCDVNYNYDWTTNPSASTDDADDAALCTDPLTAYPDSGSTTNLDDGKYGTLQLFHCGGTTSGQCTDVEWAIKAASTGTVFDVFVTDEPGYMSLSTSPGTVAKDATQSGVTCSERSGYSTPTEYGRRVFLMFKCSRGDGQACVIKHGHKYTEDASWDGSDDTAIFDDDNSVSNDDDLVHNDDTPGCSGPSTHGFSASEIVSQTLVEYGMIEQELPCGSGGCSNIKVAVDARGCSNRIVAYLVDSTSLTNVNNQQNVPDALWKATNTFCAYDTTGLTPPAATTKMYFVVGNRNDASCELSYAVSYSGAPSPTPSVTSEPSITPSPSTTPSEAATQSPTPTTTASPLPSVTPTPTPLSSVSPTGTPSPSGTSSPSVTPTSSGTPSTSVSPTSTISPGASPSMTPSPSISSTPTASVSTTPSADPSASSTVSPASTPSVTPTQSYPTPSASTTSVPTESPSTTPSASGSASPSSSLPPSSSPSGTPTNSPTPTASGTPSGTPTPASTPSSTPSPSLPPTPPPTPTPTPSSLPVICQFPERYFDAADMQRVHVPIGKAHAFNISACGPIGSCTSVRYVATAADTNGVGVFSWYAAYTKAEVDAALAHDTSGLISGRGAWTHVESRCAHEDSGLVTPPAAGETMWLVLVCETDSPGACSVDVGISYKPNPKSMLAPSPKPLPSAALGVTAEQLSTPGTIQTHPGTESIQAGSSLILPVSGCSGGSCLLDVAVVLLSSSRGYGTMAVLGDAKFPASSSSSSSSSVGSEEKLAGFESTGPYFEKRGYSTPPGADEVNVEIRCEGDEGAVCNVLYGISWIRPSLGSALTPEISDADDRLDDGARCRSSGQCQSGSCRSGICCTAEAGGPMSGCAACSAGTGRCAATITDQIPAPSDSCTSPLLDAVCGAARGDSFDCKLIEASDGGSRAIGSCECNGETRYFGAGTGPSSFTPCSTYIEYVQEDSMATTKAQKNLDASAGPSGPAGPGGDGGAAIAGAVVGTLVALAVVGGVGYRYYTFQSEETPLGRVRRRKQMTEGGAVANVFERITGNRRRTTKWEVVNEDDIPDIDSDDDSAAAAAFPIMTHPSSMRAARVRGQGTHSPRGSKSKSPSPRQTPDDMMNPLHGASV